MRKWKLNFSKRRAWTCPAPFRNIYGNFPINASCILIPKNKLKKSPSIKEKGHEMDFIVI
jgi:hypothetical protein